MSERDARAEIARLADEVLPALIARLGASSLGELEVRGADWRVRIRRTASRDGEREAEQAAGSVEATDATRRGARARGGQAGDRPPGGARPPFGEAGQRGTPSGNGGYVPVLAVGPGGSGDAPPAAAAAVTAASPAVGYYVPRDGIAPGRPVELGEVLGHIDVLGVRQDVVAPGTGVVARVLAQPGEAVEYGQELLQIEPGRRAPDASRP